MAEHDNLNLTYEEALQELQDILGRMQSNELGIDSAKDKVKEAVGDTKQSASELLDELKKD